MRRLILGLVLAGLLPAALPAQQNVIGPNGVRQPSPGDQAGNWWRDQQNGAFIDVTRSNPRVGFNGYGNGSLEMSLTGRRDDGTGYFPEWGFYYRFSDAPSGFGSLAQLSALSFDWFRTGYTLPSPGSCLDDDFDSSGNCRRPIPPADWAYKTPVLRLVLQHLEGTSPVLSELIWEGYFNQQSATSGGIGGPTAVDTWVSSYNMHLGNFWYARPPATPGSDLLVETAGCGLNTFTFWQGGASGSAIEQLLGANGCLYGLDPIVIGVGVGVGNNWPLPWHGYVDNVRMGFGTGDNYYQALDANFDFVAVPEPSTSALMVAGLLVLGAAARRRRRPEG